MIEYGEHQITPSKLPGYEHAFRYTHPESGAYGIVSSIDEAKRLIDEWSKRMEAWRYEHLCPIGRKDPETKHTHGSNGETNFYHEEEQLEGQWGMITVMFARHALDDGRWLIFPLSVNVVGMGPAAVWAKSIADMEVAMGLAERIADLLVQSRMVLKAA